MSVWILTSSPAYLTNAMNEIKQFDPELVFQRPIDLGVIPVNFKRSDEELRLYLEKNPPVFIRHLQPAQLILPLSNQAEDVEVICTQSRELLKQIPAGEEVGIQIRREENSGLSVSPAELRDLISDFAGADTWTFVSKDPQYVLSLFLTKEQVYLGVSSVEQNLSSWPGGAMRLKMEPYYPSRSRLKLEEAFYVFNLFHLDLADALDIGAAPGGWTSFLLDQGFKVTAVDTGELDARLLKKPGLNYIKQNIHEIRLPADSFDLLTSDMSWSPHLTCRRIVELAPVLREDGRAVVTIKLLNKKVTKTITEALNILKERYEILGCKQLFHNRDEVTVYLKKQ